MNSIEDKLLDKNAKNELLASEIKKSASTNSRLSVLFLLARAFSVYSIWNNFICAYVVSAFPIPWYVAVVISIFPIIMYQVKFEYQPHEIVPEVLAKQLSRHNKNLYGGVIASIGLGAILYFI